MTGRKCHKDGCDSGARWEVHLHVDCPMPGDAKRRLSMVTTIECCDGHRDDSRAYVLSPENREKLTTWLIEQGYHEPDFLSARVEFKPVANREITVLEMCCRAGCAARGLWRIKRRFAEIGRKEIRIEALTNLYVCNEHKRDTVAADFLQGDDRKATFEWLQGQGVLLPDLDRSELEFIPAAAKVPSNLI